MSKYNQSKIYKIIDNTNGNVYIGSTTLNYLSKRLAKHVHNYKMYQQKKYGYCSSYEILANNNYSIVLIENYNCNSKDDLFSRERYFIDTVQCVNLRKPIVSDVETKQRLKEEGHKHYEKHKETIKVKHKKYRENNEIKIKQNKQRYREENKIDLCEKAKIYYENNKAIVLERSKQIHHCECGVEYTQGHKSRHIQTQRHVNFLNQ